MKVKAKFGYKSAIVVDNDLLREINELITSYFIQPDYSAKVVSNDEIKFDNLEELLEYDNFSSGRVKSLSVHFGSYDEILFEEDRTGWSINSYTYSVKALFQTDSNDKSEDFKRKLKKLLDKKKQSILYTAASKFSFVHICVVVLIYSVLLNFFQLLHDSTASVMETTPALITVAIAIVIIAYAFMAGLVKILNTFFCPIVFALGENKKRYEKIKDIKSKIFWGVIVASIVSIVVTKLLK